MVERITAQEARQLSETRLAGELTAKHLTYLYECIRKVAHSGGLSWTISWGNIGSPSSVAWSRIEKTLRDAGYKVEFCDDQREGKSWHTISW